MEESGYAVALAALDEAMEVERQGEAFYKEAGEHVKDPMGKAVFQTLARDEVEHLRILQAEYDAITKDKEWAELAVAKAYQPTVPLKLFPDKRDAALIIAADASDLDALQLALDFEERGYNMYAQAAAETGDPRGKELFDFLAKQENGHYAFLQKTYDYLTTEGAWYFDEQEFPMFDGA